MNNPFDYSPDVECEEAFRHMLVKIETLKHSDHPSDMAFIRELEAGKMLGVLIAEDRDGARHALYAFSGQLGDGGFYFNGFVGPAFDYLRPDGHFRKKEADISRLNTEIAKYERDTLAKIKDEYDTAQAEVNSRINEFKEKCRLSKSNREARRASGEVGEEETAAMVRQSQHEKAELHRLKKRLASELEPLTARLKSAQGILAALREKRRADSESLQDWLFTSFMLLNARGERRSLKEIFAGTTFGIPPSGAGECCGPKLLQEAYKKGWNPVSMAEYWYGRPKDGEIRRHGEHYPACRGKCLPVLNWMLRGIDVEPPLEEEGRYDCARDPEIVFENEWFCIVDKPSGMLSVPGKGAAASVQEWLEKRYGTDQKVRMAHRLDQDTSGLLMATFGEEAYKTMQRLFSTRKVYKTYVAELAGDCLSKRIPRTGRIELPLSPDWLDRPRQRVDEENGKEAVTDYKLTGSHDGHTRVEFHPLTGRTHQLRVHSAAESGLGTPIAGDRLYGRDGGKDAPRLMLHAHGMEFTFPADNRHYCFESPVPF